MKDAIKTELINYLTNCEVMLDDGEETEVYITSEAVENAIERQSTDIFDCDEFMEDLADQIAREEAEAVLNMGDVDEDQINEIVSA